MTGSGEITRSASHCAYCGAVTIGSGLCPHHSVGYADDWARENRIMCDFIHRGVVVHIPDDRDFLEAA